MKQFSLRLDKKQQRPVVLLKGALTALLDTGAFIPVWTDNEGILTDVLGGKLVKKGVPFIGFGGVAYGNLYQVTIEVGDLVFPNMHIVANDELDTSYNLILSATMFQSLIYEVDDKNHKFNVTIPDSESNVRNLRIEDSNGRLHILCHSA
ncbi:hypothetical protein D3Z36_03690 [Lachnospiraceae bacterium]|nr:hypothetical protein [Lachnospiraceae bacterium]